MKNKEYWIKRANIEDKKMLKDSNKVVKLLKKELVKVKKEVKKELATLYVDNETPEYQKYELESILRSVDYLLDRLYHQEVGIINNTLLERYIDTYNDKVKHLGIDSGFEMINKHMAMQAIATNWSGLSFSERIWENRRRLSFALKATIKQGLIRGDSIDDMSRLLSKKLDANLKHSKRIIRTETCFVQTKANIDAYKDFGCTKYEFSAHLDARTSDVCRSLDGQVFDIKDYQAGVNAPPMHPNCRSCILPVNDD